MTFDPTTRSVLCSFLNESLIDQGKKCIANITYGINCNQPLGVFSGVGAGNSVITPSVEFIDTVSEYCLLVSAISGNVTVMVEGTLIDIGNT